jgi:dihydrofolate synthase/folylpolyglutamate synthase
MSFETAEAYLGSLGVDAMKSRPPSLERIEALCDALDHPEHRLTAIHVTGTNGKTSTARIATSLLTARGLSVGTYTSAHLQSLRERIALAGEPIDEATFGEVFDHMWPYVALTEKRLEDSLTYFELLTGLFLLWAAEAPVDVAVVEVGLGGRWDATNVISAPVAVLTNIGLDHTNLLGSTREQIAREKLGIVKRDAIVLAGDQSPEIRRLVRERADDVGAHVLVLGRDFELVEDRVALGGRYVSVRTDEALYDDLFLPLHGSHQAMNAALAIESALRLVPTYPMDREVVARGLAAVTIPGRMEVIPLEAEGSPTVVLDVAHNPDGMSALVTALAETFAFERVVFVIGVLADKDSVGMLAELSRVPCVVIATEAPNVRSIPPEKLRVAAEELGLECSLSSSVGTAVSGALRAAGPTELVCVTGSHYVVGAARDLLVDETDARTAGEGS